MNSFDKFHSSNNHFLNIYHVSSTTILEIRQWKSTNCDPLVELKEGILTGGKSVGEGRGSKWTAMHNIHVPLLCMHNIYMNLHHSWIPTSIKQWQYIYWQWDWWWTLNHVSCKGVQQIVTSSYIMLLVILTTTAW